jgi:enamine deaminase RidA (YjgF/YER057c/UK114 family)
VRCTIYLKDMSTFAEVGEVYAEFFTAEPPPA